MYCCAPGEMYRGVMLGVGVTVAEIVGDGVGVAV